MGLTLGHCSCGCPRRKATLSGGLGNLGSIVYNWVNELQASGSHTSDEKCHYKFDASVRKWLKSSCGL